MLTVRNRVENIFPEKLAKLDNLFGVAGWTGKRGTRLREPAAPGGERQQVLMAAVGTAHSGETFLQVAALEIIFDDFRYDRAVKSILHCECFVINSGKTVEMLT